MRRPMRLWQRVTRWADRAQAYAIVLTLIDRALSHLHARWANGSGIRGSDIQRNLCLERLSICNGEITTALNSNALGGPTHENMTTL
jgi:hypothetical protein